MVIVNNWPIDLEVPLMSMIVTSPLHSEEVDILAGALYSWCAEHNIKMTSQAGLSAASKAIDLYHAGYHTRDKLLGALHGDEWH